MQSAAAIGGVQVIGGLDVFGIAAALGVTRAGVERASWPRSEHEGAWNIRGIFTRIRLKRALPR